MYEVIPLKYLLNCSMHSSNHDLAMGMNRVFLLTSERLSDGRMQVSSKKRLSCRTRDTMTHDKALKEHRASHKQHCTASLLTIFLANKPYII